VNANYPDFKHKKTKHALWLDSRLKPPWVKEELAAMAPGAIQLSVFQWNAKLARCVTSGHYEKTLEIFQQMQQEGIIPDGCTFVHVLNACSSSRASLEEGQRVHKQIIESGCENNVFVSNSLVDMYAKCGSISDAWRVFDRMATRDVISWTAMILGLVKNGQVHKALELSQQMQHEGVQPDHVTFVGLLNACGSKGALEEGKHVHKQIVQSGCESDIYIGSSLIDMYVKCGSLEDATKVFNSMAAHDVASWTAIIAGHVKSGQEQKALELWQQMRVERVQPAPVTLVQVLNACASVAALEEGRWIHELIIHRGYDSDVFLGNSLIDMYAKCGSIEDAERVFTSMVTRNVVSWNAIILGHVKCGQGQKALELSHQMQFEGLQPDHLTYVGLLNACASVVGLDEGRHVHEQIIQSHYETNILVGNSLVDMYAKCGSIEDAQSVFNNMTMRNVVSWTNMIWGRVKCGHGQKALELSQQMQSEGVQPDHVTFVGLLSACASVGAFEEGKKIHKQIIQNGCESDVFVGSSLVDMYAKCGSLQDAQSVFDRMATRNVVSWTALISGYVKCGQGQKALELSRQMQHEGVQPDSVTFVGVLNACASVGSLDEGRHAHNQIIQSGYDVDILVANGLVEMYAKCGSMEEAQRIFNNMTTHDVVAWNAMILGHVKCGQGQKALEFWQQMQHEGVQPAPVTYMGVLNACASVASVKEGRHVHKLIMQSRYQADVSISNSLIDMYVKCGSIADAQQVFNSMATHDVVSWNAMMWGHVKCGQGQKVLELWQQMHQEEVQPDRITFLRVLNTCATVAALEEGRAIHKQIVQTNYEADVYVGSSLVNMYAKCGSIEDAQRVFNNMASHDVVSWTAMIVAHVNCGQAWKALELSQQMQNQGVQPDHVTFVGMLNACADVLALEEGRRIHESIIQCGCESDAFVGSSLIDMYTKCGSIEDAQRVFNRMVTPDVITWTAMLRGHAMHGHGREAIQHFEQMGQDGVEIDDVTFIALLSACNHAGLVDEGLHCFESMGSVYSIPATVKHYACMVDLLGRAGHLQEAQDLIKSGPGSAEDAAVWRSLLGACRIHGDVEMGENIAIRVIELDPGNDAAYVLLSNIYAAAGKWDLRAKVQQLRLDRGVEKQVGSTSIEMKNEVHTFLVDDQHHPQINEIHTELKRLSHKMNNAPNLSYIM
jgi:pentatricopeptide repeat protein